MAWFLFDRRVRRLAIAAAIALAATPPVQAGLLVSTDPAGAIEMSVGPLPPELLGSSSDFSMLGWVRRTTPAGTGTRGILAGGSPLRVAFDDDAGALRVEMRGTPDLAASVPLTGVPVDEWMLWAMTWDANAGALTAWAQSESIARAEATTADAGWSGGSPFPFTIGAVDGNPGFAGQVGLIVARGHGIDASDFDLVWNGGVPRYFAPALLETGSFDGFPGIAWMAGHGVATNPETFVNPGGIGSEIGDAITTSNVLVYSTGDFSNTLTVGEVANVTGAWSFQSPHEPGEPWAGFFVRETPDLGLDGGPTSSQIAPASRRLALDDPQGHIRVIASANSRGTKFSTSYDRLDNWAYGGLYGARRPTTAGVIVPAKLPPTKWPFFYQVARVEGDVNDSTSTPHASVAFGSFGSHGADNSAFTGFLLSGRAVVLEPGAAYIPKARPELGTRLDEATDPVTVRAMTLRFPGAGAVEHDGAKAATQTTATYTTVGAPTVLALDTTIAMHALAKTDAYSPATAELVMDNAPAGIVVGDGCFIGDGPGADGISMIVDVKIVGPTTTVTLERRFPVDPVPGASTLHFGPVEAVWIEQAWAGLDQSDPEVYRGVRLEAVGGLVVVLYVECFNPDVDGFIIGASGRSGRGYASQLDELFDVDRMPFVAALAPDVWMQFFAHQGSPATSMASYAAALQRSSSATEIWWCGDPDFDLLTTDIEGTDSWQQYILDNAAAAGVGAIVAHEHPLVGTGFERVLDGQVGDLVHPTARGAAAHVTAVLDLMTGAAIDPTPKCPADIDGNGAVDFSDLTTLLAAWGVCPACAPDLNGDGMVAFGDITTLLAAWGPCR